MFLNQLVMLHQQAKVKYAVLNAPYLIPLYMKPPYNPVITKSTLKRMLNRSCGLEIECFGSLMWEFNQCFEEFPVRVISKKVKLYYDIEDYDEDNFGEEAANEKFDKYNHNEHKIRIKDHSQLNGLYEILMDMKKYCRLNMGSGIHIHVDVSDIYKAYDGPVKLEKYYDHFEEQLYTKLDEIEHIFYPNGKYEGGYNYERQAKKGKGRNWVAIRPDKHTIEFRIAPMTFEYTEIVGWLVKLNKMVNWTISQSPFMVSHCNIRTKKKLIKRNVVKVKPKTSSPVTILSDGVRHLIESTTTSRECRDLYYDFSLRQPVSTTIELRMALFAAVCQRIRELS